MGLPQPLSPSRGMVLNSVCEAVPREEKENGDAGARVRKPPPFGEGVPGRGARDQQSAPEGNVVSMDILFVRGVPGVPPTWLSPAREIPPGE